MNAIYFCRPASCLVNVNVSKNDLTSCLFLEKCAEVTTVNLSNNKIEKTKPLRVLSKLRVLNISHNLVPNMSSSLS